MKLHRITFLILTVYALSFAGCKKSYIISEKQQILFQVDYINYAWGYQHSGFIIDINGKVLSYSNPESWNFHDDEMNLTEDQVTENISRCSLTGITIPKEELDKYAGYIRNIASSKVTAPRNVAADAGTTQYICYQFDEYSDVCKGSLIKTEGDFSSENLNFYSKKVALWLKDVYSSINVK